MQGPHRAPKKQYRDILVFASEKSILNSQDVIFLAGGDQMERIGDEHRRRVVICVSCQAENSAPGRFCRQCGSALLFACLSCGTINNPDDKFCGGCGTSLVRLPPAQLPRDLSETPEFPRAPRLPHLEGERRHLTVLFCDMVGSTSSCQGAGPRRSQRDHARIL